jgi:hypothetical protein
MGRNTMWGLLIAFGAVGGLISLSLREAAEPTIKPALLKRRLAKLARTPRKALTLDQAEDGVVLSRRLKESDLERRFVTVASSLRSKRPKK